MPLTPVTQSELAPMLTPVEDTGQQWLQTLANALNSSRANGERYLSVCTLSYMCRNILCRNRRVLLDLILFT